MYVTNAVFFFTENKNNSKLLEPWNELKYNLCFMLLHFKLFILFLSMDHNCTKNLKNMYKFDPCFI